MKTAEQHNLPIVGRVDLIEAKPNGGPRISSGKDSKQDYRTPDVFLRAVVEKFGGISFDLAATHENRIVPGFFSEEQDSLKQDWHKMRGNLWLNPPFKDIAPWAGKCFEESLRGATILFLVPASVDSNWWAEYVHEKAFVYFCSPRISFDGKDPYPKPMALCHYTNRGLVEKWYQPWRWK